MGGAVDHGTPHTMNQVTLARFTGRGALFGVSTVLLSQPASSRPWNDRRGVRTAGGMLTGRASCERGRYFRYSMGTSWSVL